MLIQDLHLFLVVNKYVHVTSGVSFVKIWVELLFWIYENKSQIHKSECTAIQTYVFDLYLNM